MPETTIVYLTDRTYRPVTDPLEWTSVDATVRYLEPGSGAVTCPASDALMGELATPGRRAVLLHRNQVWLAGPIERPHGRFAWSEGSAVDAGPGRVTFHFADDLALVLGRITYPDPTSPWSDQTAAAYYTDSGTASTVILDLVDANAGPNAIEARRVPQLVMGTDPLAGDSVSLSTRFAPLGDELRALVAAAGGSIGFRTVVDVNARETTFEVFQTVDRSASVKFSRALGNLRAISYETEIPRTTAALVAGQGEGADRTTVERVDTAAEEAWYRIEQLRDRRDTDDLSILEQAGDELLERGAASARLATVTVDTPDQRFGEHFGLGDLVTVELVPGDTFTETVRGAHLQVTPDAGAIVTSLIGTQAALTDPEWLRQVRELSRRLATLEAV